MLPVLITPLHDPGGTIFDHLKLVKPDLKRVFSQAFMSVTDPTVQNHPADLDRLRMDGFYFLVPTHEKQVGVQFAGLYQQAVSQYRAEQVLHLRFLDRLAFILQSAHKETFTRDILMIEPADTPLLFCRSKRAWDSHPQNYRQIEQFATRIGQFLFGFNLDYAWCHLAVQAGRLEKALGRVCNRDLSVLAEISLDLMETLRVQEVDWLEWEDPFLLNRNPLDLKEEREGSVLETEKRLAYILPTIQTLLRFRKERFGEK